MASEKLIFLIPPLGQFDFGQNHLALAPEEDVAQSGALQGGKKPVPEMILEGHLKRPVP